MPLKPTVNTSATCVLDQGNKSVVSSLEKNEGPLNRRVSRLTVGMCPMCPGMSNEVQVGRSVVVGPDGADEEEAELRPWDSRGLSV